MSKKKKKQSEIIHDEILLNEVADYYKNAEIESEDISVKQKDSEKFSFGFDINDRLSEEILEVNNEGPLNNVIFYLAVMLLAVFSLSTAYRIGINMNSSKEKTDYFVDEIKSSDVNYNNALEKQEELNNEIAKLTGETLDAKERKGSIEEFADTQKKLEEKLSELENQQKTLNDQLYAKRQELKEAKNNGGGEYSVTLTPGVYTVGKNLPQGTYNVTGAGSLIASTAARETKINEQLNSEKPVSVKLESGYMIKINKYTTFKLSSGKD